MPRGPGTLGTGPCTALLEPKEQTVIRTRMRGRTARALPTALVTGGIAVSMGACGATNPADPVADPITTVPPSATLATVADARTTHLAEALATEGFPAVLPDQTLFALADGVCRQIAAGTPDAEILTQLQPTAAYAASQSGGAITAERSAELLLDSTRRDFC